MAQRVHLRRHVADAHRAADAVQLRLPEGVILELPEVGEHLAPRPAWVAGGGPVVEIPRLATYVHHGVDRARAAEHLAARPELAAVVERRVVLSLVHPVETPIVESTAIADRHLDPGRAVGPAGLE